MTMEGICVSEPRGEVSRDRELDILVPEDRLAALMDAFEGSVYSFLVTLVGDADLAADCAQDTFIRAYQQLCKRRTVTKQWLYRVARNRAMDEYRRRTREEKKLGRLPEPVAGSLFTESGDEGVHRALQTLSWEDREVLYLWAVDGFSGRQISDLLGVRAEAVHMRVSRARQRFRAAYGDGV